MMSWQSGPTALAYQALAAGLNAAGPVRVCRRCAGPLTATSRTAGPSTDALLTWRR